MTIRSANAAERVSKAIVDLRRNPQNRAIQRKLYSVGDCELTPVQVDILEAVVANPGQRMNELAKALAVDASTVSRTILPLVDLCLVARRPGQSDRRLTHLFPTDAGLSQAGRIAEARQSMMRAVQGHFTPNRLALLADLLEEYIRAVTAEGAALRGTGSIS